MANWQEKVFKKRLLLIAELEKSFYIFDIVVDGKSLNLPDIEKNSDRIYFINQFKTFEVDIDFNDPYLIQNTLIDLTLSVEEKCPVASALSDNLECLIGEGIVWHNSEYDLRFKTKGEKHSNSKVKTLKQIAAIDIEKINNIKEFCSNSLTENRLNQGIEKLKELGLDPNDMKNIAEFIRWCVSDVLREENDVIEQSQFDSKILAKELSMIARNFYKNYY